jgi:dihydropteroate synthase
MKKTQLMGILNCTPNSFFEQGRAPNRESAVALGKRLFEEGADLVDIGGEATAPGSHPISEEEEMERVLPVIQALRRYTSKPLSIDTYKPSVARRALESGASFINDITGFSDPEMRKLAAESGVPICVMHMGGPPHTNPVCDYPQGIIEELLLFFQKRIALLVESGIQPSQIILDPGIGAGCFGKSVLDSLSIIRNLKTLRSLGFPLLIGLSRKSFMQKILQKSPSEILSTTLALNTMSILEGVEIIRVHDVQPHRDILTVLEELQAIPIQLQALGLSRCPNPNACS